MIRLAISVEGDTEEEFVKQVMADHLRPIGIEPVPYLLSGNVTAPRLAGEMANLYLQHHAVTSLVDFYGFKQKAPTDTVEKLQEDVLQKIASDPRLRFGFDAERVFPYVQQYEFEGLLFADIAAFGTLLNLPEGTLERLQTIRQQFATPEEINDSILTAPSKRIANIIPRYNKKVDGAMLAQIIGLDRIRVECPRFDRWLSDLEALAQ